jgi:hypothetical protein
METKGSLPFPEEPAKGLILSQLNPAQTLLL